MAWRTGMVLHPSRRQPLVDKRCEGAMLLLVMFIVAVIGIMLSVAGPVWRTEMRRDKEAELLWIGDHYASAISRYYAASPTQARQYPRQLRDLLLDRRQPNTVRYLRRLYRDPFTGSTEWGLVKDGSGNIMGVYSRGTGAPLKQGGFDKGKSNFNDAKSYADWAFVARPPASLLPTGNAPQTTPPASAGMASPMPLPSKR
jgi:type II secretory pathway pseudopilin PulG